MKGPRFQPVELLALSILASIASFFRLHGLTETLVFQGDQGRALLAARDILGGQLTLIGPETSISGFHLGPFFYYLIAPALWFANYDPLGPAVLTALFGVGTVLLLFLYGRKYFSFEAGITMALLYTLSPHAIWQSRIALEPSPVPFFSILWLMAATEWRFTKRRRWLSVALATLFFGSQLNFSFIALLPATLWLGIAGLPITVKKKLLVQTFALIALGFTVLARSFIRPVTSWSFFQHIWTELTLPMLPLLAVLIPAFCLIGAGYLHWKKHSGRLSPHILPVLAWFVFSFAGFVLKYVSGEHSLAVLFPAPAIFGGIALFLLTQDSRWKQKFAFTVVTLVSLLLTYQAWNYLQLRQSTTLTEYETVSDHILRLAKGEPYRLVYRGHLDVYEAADDQYQYLLWKAGNPPVQSYRREITPETQDEWNIQEIEAAKTIVLYQPPFNFTEYRGFQEAEEWNGRWFVVEEKTP